MEPAKKPSIGCRDLVVADAIQDASIAVRLYPARALESTLPFGPFSIDVARDASPDGSALPLVLISHGTGSAAYLHRNLASHLARAGFVVALVTHPGNNRADDSVAGRAINLQNRPRHLRLVIDAAFSDEILGPHLSNKGVAVIGHSLGGYTALAIAGGVPVVVSPGNPRWRRRSAPGRSRFAGPCARFAGAGDGVVSG